MPSRAVQNATQPTLSGFDGAMARSEESDWTYSEKSWLRRHLSDGIAVIALCLNRSARDVATEAERLGLYLPAWPERGEVCPWCGRRMARSNAGYLRGGVCETCWLEYKAAALRDAESERRARREYDRARVGKQRHG